MIKPRCNNKINTIFMGFDSMEISLVDYNFWFVKLWACKIGFDSFVWCIVF